MKTHSERENRIRVKLSQILLIVISAVMLIFFNASFVLGIVADPVLNGNDIAIVADYPFNGNAKDAAVYEASLTNDRLGSDNGAYDFNGTTGFISTPIDINPDKIPILTMMAWVYPRKTGENFLFSGKNTRLQILSHDDGNFDRSLLIEGKYWNVFTGGNNWYTHVPADVRQWQHVAVVFEESDVKFYKNGVMYSYGQAPGRGTSVNMLTIGKNPGEWDEFFDGIIDDVLICSRALSKEEIQAFCPQLISVSISGLSTIPENSYGSYKLTAACSDGMTQDVTTSALWSENSVYASLTDKGVMKTTTVASTQSVTLKAGYTYNGVTKTASVPVTIVPRVLSSVMVTGAPAISGGSYSDYNATALFADGTTQDVTVSAVWAENSAYASTDYLTKGRMKTAAVHTEQTVTLTARYIYKGTAKTGSATVMITVPPQLNDLSVTVPFISTR